MSETETKFDSWDEVILDFFKRKRDTEEEKYLKEKIKEVGGLFKKEGLLNNNDVSLIFDTKRNRKNKGELPLEFQRRRAREVLKLDNKPERLNIFREKKLYIKHFKSISEKYTPSNWLTANSKNASNVSFATHVAKLTHSKIDSPSIFDSIQAKHPRYLTTSSLKEKIVDGAVAGNQFAPIFQFLELELNGSKLAEQLQYDNKLLKSFSEDGESGNNQLQDWLDGFVQSLKPNKPATHSLAKQIYFPIVQSHMESVANEQGYHLLPTIVSSSLAHSIYETVFDDTQKPVKKSFESNKYLDMNRKRYIARSHICVTASNHSNASQLNGKRAGKLHLFSTQPPTWQSQLKPPINRKSLFDAIYNSTITTEMDYLRDFLLRFKRLDLSIKDPKRKQHLERWVDNIIDECLFYIASIQNLPAGWSDTDNIRLKPEHQFLLDPYHLDETFQKSRQNTDWKAVVRADFAQWMNWQLRGKDKQFTPQAEHTRFWKKQFEQSLREHMEPIEHEVKHAMKEAV